MKADTLSTLNDEAVIDLYRTTGLQSYLATIYHRYNQRVYRKCFQITKDENLAKDYTHDIFIIRMLKINRFEKRSAFSTWLYSLTRNYCLTRQRNAQLAIGLPLADVDSLLDEYSEADDFNLFLLPKALNNRPTDEMNLLIMKYYEGLEVSEISKQLTISTGAIKMRLKRSRAKLKKQIDSWIDA